MSMSYESSADFNSPTENADTRAESLGAWLARARASHGTEPRDAARRLGLHLILIQAIENDDFEHLGPPVFVRSYLSRYARFLKLSESVVLDRYRQQVDTSREPPPLKVVHLRRWQTQVLDLRGSLYLLVIISIVWTAAQNLGDPNPGWLSAWWSSSYRDSVAQQASSPMAVTTQKQYPFQPKFEETAREPSPLPTASTASEPASPHRLKPDPASAITQLALHTPSPAIRPELALAVSSVAIATTTTISGAVVNDSDSPTPDTRFDARRLMLQFSEDCWVEVKDAQSKVLTNGLMKANTTHVIAGPAPFTVTLGNAPAARIALDDRPVDAVVYMPRRGTVSRFTLIPSH